MSTSTVLALLAEPRRQKILRVLWGGERSAGEIHREIGEVTFGAVSQHLGKLRDAGVVRGRKDGRRRIYSLDRERLGPLARALDEMWGDGLARLKRVAEKKWKGEEATDE